MPLPWVKTVRIVRVRIFRKSSVDIPGLKSAVMLTEFSLIDLSSALHTVTSDSFVVENYQVPFLRSKTRLKKTLIKVAYEPSVYEGIQEEGLVAEKLQ